MRFKIFPFNSLALSAFSLTTESEAPIPAMIWCSRQEMMGANWWWIFLKTFLLELANLVSEKLTRLLKVNLQRAVASRNFS